MGMHQSHPLLCLCRHHHRLATTRWTFLRWSKALLARYEKNGWNEPADDGIKIFLMARSFVSSCPVRNIHYTPQLCCCYIGLKSMLAHMLIGFLFGWLQLHYTTLAGLWEDINSHFYT